VKNVGKEAMAKSAFFRFFMDKTHQIKNKSDNS
jgi:hypothetical protein